MKYKFYNYPSVIYIIFFCLYFSPFPLNHSFAGNTDVIVHTVLFKEYILKIKEFLGFGTYGYSFFPIEGTSLFLENMFGHAAIFILCKMLFLPDYLATYILIITLCVLNGMAVNKVILNLTKNYRAAFVFGLAFSASCYMLSNMEFLNGISFFPIIFSFYFLNKFSENSNINDFYKSIAFLSIQLFFSGYYFLVGGIFLFGYFLLINFKHKTKINAKHILLGLGILTLCCIPTLSRLVNSELIYAYNPAKSDIFALDKFTIKPISFLTSFPQNLIYGHFQSHYTDAFRANNGIIILLLLVFGMFNSITNKFFLIISGIAAFLISLGSFNIPILNTTIPSPFNLLFEWNILGNYFRLPYRFYTITFFVIILIASFGYIKLESKFKNKSLLAVIVMFIFLIENIEYKVYTTNQQLIMKVPDPYFSLPSKDEKNYTIADFPSSLFTDSDKKLSNNEYRREYIYMYWQTYHHQNIINGSASYFPKSRMQNNEWMKNITKDDNLHKLISINKLDYIIFHKNLIYHPSEWKILTFFENSGQLQETYRDESMVIFYIKS